MTISSSLPRMKSHPIPPLKGAEGVVSVPDWTVLPTKGQPPGS